MIVGVDCTNIGYGGGGILVANYLNAFHPKLLVIDKFIIWTNKGFAKRLKDKPFFNVKIVNEAESTKSRFFWQTFKLRKEAEQNNCDLLIFPGGLYLGKFRPFIAVAQNLLPFHKEALKLYKWKEKYFRYLLLRWLHIKTFNSADQVFYLSEESSEIIEKYINRDQRAEDRSQTKQANHLRTFSDFRIINPVLSPQFYRTKWIPPNNEVKKILYVASLKLYKNHIPLCREIKKRIDAGEKLELVLVGETIDTDAEIILSEIKQLNRYKKFINVIGFVEHNNILKYYFESDYYVFPSLCETFGLPKHEAEKIGLQYYS